METFCLIWNEKRAIPANVCACESDRRMEGRKYVEQNVSPGLLAIHLYLRKRNVRHTNATQELCETNQTDRRATQLCLCICVCVPCLPIHSSLLSANIESRVSKLQAMHFQEILERLMLRFSSNSSPF